MGIDTVNLKVNISHLNVTQGQKIKEGVTRLGTADLEAIKQAGYDTTVMVIVTKEHNELMQVLNTLCATLTIEATTKIKSPAPLPLH